MSLCPHTQNPTLVQEVGTTPKYQKRSRELEELDLDAANSSKAPPAAVGTSESWPSTMSGAQGATSKQAGARPTLGGSNASGDGSPDQHESQHATAEKQHELELTRLRLSRFHRGTTVL